MLGSSVVGSTRPAWVQPSLARPIGDPWLLGICKNKGELRGRTLGDKCQLQIPKCPPVEQRNTPRKLKAQLTYVVGVVCLLWQLLREGGAGVCWLHLLSAVAEPWQILVTLKTTAPSPGSLLALSAQDGIKRLLFPRSNYLLSYFLFVQGLNTINMPYV